MKHALSLILWAVSSGTAAAVCQTERLSNDIDWCLNSGPADIKGRTLMNLAIEANRPDAFLHGFASCQDDKAQRESPNVGQRTKNESIGNALSCYGDDRVMVLNTGRRLLDVPIPDPTAPAPQYPSLGTLQLRHGKEAR